MRDLHSFLLPILVLLAATLPACGDDGTTMTGDTGAGDATADAPPDAGDTSMPPAVDVCESTMMVAGELGTTTVSGDTSVASTRARDLGGGCGNTMAARFAPQEVIAYTVPGDVELAIEFTTDVAGTDAMFDTLVQVRSDCTMVPPDDPPSCFDDIGGGNFRSAGAVNAMGGDTIYLVVTGYSETPVEDYEDRGAWTLEITARENTAPTLTGGTLQVIVDEFVANLQGSDPDGDITGWNGVFLDDAGEVVDLNGDGTPDAEGFTFGFDDSVEGMTDVDATTTLGVVDAGPPEVTFFELLMDAGATQAEVRLVDRVFAESDPMTFTIDQPTVVGLGETCDGTDIICSRGLLCESMACAAPPEVTAACGAATALTISTPTTATTSTTTTGAIAVGDGHFEGACGMTDGGAETLYTVDVPGGGPFDLLARTDLAGTADADTVVYVRSTCEDPGTELACSDDVAMDVLGSSLEALDLAAGTYTIVVEAYGGAEMSTPFELEASLRPVLASGASCDDAGVDNRCAGGACAGGTCP